MTKKVFLFSFLTLASVSCSSISEEYKSAARELCECMNENGYENNDAGNVKMNIGVCLLDAAVDVKNPQMAIEIGKKCPELKEGFEEFVEDLGQK